MFDFVEEPFDEIAFAIECEVAKPLNNPVGFWWNNDDCAFVGDELYNGISVVTLVGQNAGCANVFQKGLRLGAVGDVSGCQNQANGIAQRVAQGVEFCGQPPPA